MLAQRSPKRLASAALSGARVSRYALVRRCIGGYLSPILVDSILSRAMETCKGVKNGAPEDLLQAVVEESIKGLRLFVEPSRLPELVSRLRVLSAPDL